MKTKTIFVQYMSLTLLTILLGACSGAPRMMPAFPRATPRQIANPQEFISAVDAFYSAENLEQAKKAVENAKKIGPDSAATHEIIAGLSMLEGNESLAWRHYYLALASKDNPAAAFHFSKLLEIPMSNAEYRETLALLKEIVEKHPNRELRRVAAAFVASWELRLNADTASAHRALEKRGSIKHFAVASAFDNEDGQGFTVEYPPEREIDFSKEYAGTQMPARWRRDVVLDHQQSIDFANLISPGVHVVAYALTYIHVPSGGEYNLRLTTTDPIKVWVNDIQMLGEQRVTDDSVDQFRIPVVLRSGFNKVLIKSCHETGSWQLGAVLTDSSGSLVKDAKSSSGPEIVEEGAAPGPGYNFADELAHRLEKVDGKFRKMYLAIDFAELAGLEKQVQDLADAYRTAVPRGVVSRLTSALTSWSAGQKGQTIDLLDELIKENETIARMYVHRSDYFEQQDRPERVREDLLKALEINPEFKAARHRLAEYFSDRKWTEDHLKTRLEDVERWPDDTRALWGLAAAYTKMGRHPLAEEIYLRILKYWQGASDILSKMARLEIKRNAYDEALEYQNTLVKLFPNTPSYYLKKGEILRRAKRFGEAKEVFEKCRKIDDRWSTPVKRLGAIAYERGEYEDALGYWKTSLELDPDNHALADRIEFLEPRDETILDEFAPDAEAIEKVIKNAENVDVYSGSDIVYLLDHSVEQVELDGSSRQIVTQVALVVNDTGRDKLTRYDFPHGRLQVVEAYSVDPEGVRYEASSLRSGRVRFREIKVGSKIVVQFRLDAYPGGYLSRHLFRRWFFHSLGVQFEDSHYVLVLPGEMKINEHRVGDWKRSERESGSNRIVEYRGKNVPPLVMEPFSPPPLDLMQQVVISSIPDWETIAGWDAALLVDVFRSSPKIVEVAKRLTKGLSTKREKLDAITRFVMREIRYQQDYENTIAGVKPHAASVVLQRAYGDCKDKSVLIMTLAREVGIDTRFAILRTTGIGEFLKDLPALQFNHAIVYVPAQDGIDEAFFIDGTPDTLDISVLRPDAQDTWAMTIEPDSKEWEFVKIPRGSADQHYTLRRSKVNTQIDGNSVIDLSLTLKGPAAAALRAVLRNKDDSRILIAQLANSLFPGSHPTALSVEGEDDIVRPINLRITVETDSLIRKQDEAVVIELPKSSSMSRHISLAERKLPLRTGLFLSLVETEDEVILPDGYVVDYVPEDVKSDNQFFSFERTVERREGELLFRMRFEEKSNQISPKEYPEYRAAVKNLVEALDQELVLKPQEQKKKKKSKKKKTR